MELSRPTALAEARRQNLATGSPEAIVHELPDVVLYALHEVERLTRGPGWDPEPERFLAAAQAEREWRKKHGIRFGWYEG